jgi:hypothetical protein
MVEDEADTVDVEGFASIDIRSRQWNDLESHIHCSLLRAAQSRLIAG